ncbi:Putative metabolite transport protein YjhB [Pseudomonas fluorescens]|uniref:Metabolite transport protein YjhB n=1 Tax=Pseudomonas fluorescens TaxID=294 RepID=A0A5E6T5V5_PSEFL|nr:MFS transporter [Pseudomonas fluorescens]VVM88514.1 Putative metabolite transport protein YjhB [Pseudomonas fluorescens]
MNRNPSVLKWHVLVGCFLSYLFDALEIIVLVIALPDITQSLQITQTQAGLLVTATLLGIGFSSIIMGKVADTLGRRPALLLSLASFGLLTMATAGASEWYQFLTLRFLAGLGLGGVWSIAAAYVNETWPSHQRARATSFVLSAFSLGAALAAAMAAYLLPLYGWRVLFFISGAMVSIAMVYVWFCVPESKAWLAQRADRQQSAANLSELFSPVLRRKTLLGTLASALVLTAYWGSMTWLPTFLVAERGLDAATMAGFMVLLNAGAFLGYNAFGLLADFIGKKRTIIISLTGSGLMLPVYTVATDHASLLIIGPVFAFFLAFVGLAAAYFAEMFPTHLRATGTGFCFNVGRGISAFAPLALGSAATVLGFATSIALCGALFLLAAGVIALLPTDISIRNADLSILKAV